MNSNETTKSKPSWLRFSIRAMLILCAVVAIAAGIVGRPVNNYLRENRALQALESAGAEVTLKLVRPTELLDGLLYRLGHRASFRHIAKVKFDVRDEFSDELAELLAGLPHLSHLTFENVPITNAQLKNLAESNSLEEMGIAILTDRSTQTLTDEGVLALQDHPTLRWIVLRGCHVSDDVYRKVLQSLTRDPVDKTDDPFLSAVAAELKARRLFEINSSGVKIDALVEWDGVERLTPTIDDNAKTLVLQPLGTEMDMARLQYVLPKSARWDLRFRKRVELSSFGVKTLLKQLEPYQDRIVAITAYDTSAELWAMLEVCPNVKDLRILSRIELRRMAGGQVSLSQSNRPIERFFLANRNVLNHVSPEGLDAKFLDDHIDNLIRLTSLEQLHIPNAAITSGGLRKLMASNLKLDKLSLPNTCRESIEAIEQSGLSKSVTTDGRLMTGIPRTDVVFDRFGRPTNSNASASEGLAAIDRYRNLLREATFPRPDNCPRRPEDHIRFQLRRRIVSLAAVDEQISPKRAVKLIEETLDTPLELQVPVEELLERFATRQPEPPSTSKETSEPRAGTGKVDAGQLPANETDGSQVRNLYAALAGNYEKLELIEKALEMRVRELACSNKPTPNVRSNELNWDLRRLCHQPCESQLAKKLRDFIFLCIHEDQTVYSAPTHAFADSHAGREDIVPLLAPRDKQFVSISTETESDLHVYLGAGREVHGEGSIPVGQQIAYVERKFFPLTVTLADFHQFAPKDRRAEVKSNLPPSDADSADRPSYLPKSDADRVIRRQVESLGRIRLK